ncbi:AraC family transcriptional regulator [Pseudomonas aeruginosa]|uniref:AraC family transcriptional regulator n=1 Tax=Pseudomonas aeruginosa TaxID=287 RepID=UPI00053D68C4|nr:AraC family transcriptional regulator [Pseudomonas aeruginosa]MBH8910418.1 AraC family transcriptional regulator [Pseudomonas aeruginosa]MBI8706949.1 AraC family transcriptional regulator [Pseudomonas aeruginosa]
MNITTEFWRDPAMPYVESRRACNSRACYRPHSHPTFSIGAVDDGSSVFTGAPGGPVALHPGSLVLVPPACVHACNPTRERTWSYQMLHLDAEWLLAIRQEGAEALDHPKETPIRITREPSLYARFCRLNGLLFSDATVHDKEATLIEFVGDCDNAAGQRIAAPTDAAAHRQRLHPLLEMLRNEPSCIASVGELAQMVGMSRYQMIRAFRAATGLTPHAWQLNQRINHAREQLQAGDDLADIAYRLGFADQSHFQRIFKAHAGVTPGRYRS